MSYQKKLAVVIVTMRSRTPSHRPSRS